MTLRTRPLTWLSPAIFVVFCTACAVGPDYHAPADEGDLAGVPSSWHARLPHGGTVSALAQWWRQFDDPLLTELVETADVRHPSIAAAAIGRASCRGQVYQYVKYTVVAGSITKQDTTT